MAHGMALDPYLGIYVEDTAHVSGHYGRFVLAVRNDTASALAGSNGDYIPLTTDSAGRLHVTEKNSGTIANLAKTGATAADPSSAGVFVFAVRNDSASGFMGVDDGDYSPFSVDDGGRVGICDLGGSITIDGTVAVSGIATATNRTTGNVDLDMTVSDDAEVLAVDGCGTATIQLSSAWSGTVSFEATDNGTDWFAINALVPTTGAAVTSATGNGRWIVPCAGWDQLRCRVSSTGSGTAIVHIQASSGCQAVSLANPLPTGTNAIGKLAANSGVDIGDVDITSVVPGTAATSLGKAEDAGHTTGDTGVMALAVRKDTATALAGTDGDYIPLITDSSGRLHVSEGGAALTSLQLIDDAIYATNGAISKSVAIAGQYDDTGTTTATEDAVAPVRITAQRALHVNLRNASGTTFGDALTPFSTVLRNSSLTEIGTSGNPISVQAATDTVTLVSGTFSSLGATVSATVSGYPTVTVVLSTSSGFAGTVTFMDGYGGTGDLVYGRVAGSQYNSAPVSSITFDGTETATGKAVIFHLPGYSTLTLYAPKYTTGSLTVTVIGHRTQRSMVIDGGLDGVISPLDSIARAIGTPGNATSGATSIQGVPGGESVPIKIGQTVDVRLRKSLPEGYDHLGEVTLKRASDCSAPREVTVGTSAVLLLPANNHRKKLHIHNSGTQIVRLSFNEKPVAATNYHVALIASGVADNGSGGSWTDDVFTGDVWAIAAGAGGTVIVSEFY